MKYPWNLIVPALVGASIAIVGAVIYFELIL